ncbi:MAG TPA: hypothetical protein VG122_21275 [Gemmata sp.]|jgi:hypothetical protein|nr:hypothetical protein [Gemmata sp.]
MFRTFAAVAVLAMAAPAVRAAADPLDEALFGKAKTILESLKAKGFKNVGVVKFLVQRADGPPQDDVGDLNQTLANKLEVALILANTDDKFGIIEKPSEAVRGKLPPTNHLNEDGRKAFFGRKYDLSWSADKVEASGFLTGVATLSPDLTKLTIRFQAFDKTGKLDDLAGELPAPTNPEMLAQAGFSYALAANRQKAFVAGDPPPPKEALQREIVEQVAKTEESTTKSPTENEPFAPLGACPIKWTILYNGKPVSVAGNTVPEPKSTDRIEFELSNSTQGTYAVVLLVNGENTLYQERGVPQVCRKWVLGPNSSVTVRGFQTDADTVAPFSVLPSQQPIPDAVRYGDHAGTYRLVVFHGRMSSTEPTPDTVASANPNDASALAISRTRGGTRPPGVKPQTLKALQADLRGRLEGGSTRGYVVKGSATEKFETTSVHFIMSSESPVADISLRYVPAKK